MASDTDTLKKPDHKEGKARLFIYDRREMMVLLALGIMIGIFSFTLGIHFGKQVGSQSTENLVGFNPPLETTADIVPNRQDLSEQSVGVPEALDETLNQAIHDEVARTGIKLEKVKPVVLPEALESDKKPVPPVTEQQVLEQDNLQKANKLTIESYPPANRALPDGAYTLQVGSHAKLELARDQVEALEAVGLKPYVRQAELKSGQTRFRVYLGGFDSVDVAEDAGKGFKSKSFIDSYLVVDAVE